MREQKKKVQRQTSLFGKLKMSRSSVVQPFSLGVVLTLLLVWTQIYLLIYKLDSLKQNRTQSCWVIKRKGLITESIKEPQK